jgi:hypothetical protein
VKLAGIDVRTISATAKLKCTLINLSARGAYHSMVNKLVGVAGTATAMLLTSNMGITNNKIGLNVILI